MKPFVLSSTELRVLAALAVFGLLVPNGVFVYYYFNDPEVTRIAMSNPISLVFMTEAFFLMFLFAWLLRKVACTKPNGLAFIIMSLAGSMVFSVPAALWLAFRNREVK